MAQAKPKKPLPPKAPKKKSAPAGSLREKLLAATGADPQAEDESLEDFQLRIAGIINDLSEKDYVSLPPEVKDWFNLVVELNEKDQLSDLPDIDAIEDEGDEGGEAEEKSDEEEGEDEPEEKAPPVKKGKKEKTEEPEKPEKKEKPEKQPKEEKQPEKKEKPEKKPKAAEEAAPRVSGSSVARIIICERPEISLEELKAELKARGVKITDAQAHAVHNMTVRVLKVLKQLGKLK